MEEVPNPILVNILSRLPFKTIHICKCVCKSWLDIFSDPYFADTHFKFSKTCILAHPLLINVKPKCKNPFLLDWKVPNLLGCDAIVKFDPNAILLSDYSVMMNSCDGLVCLWYPRLCGELCVCNPTSGEYVMIPPSKTDSLHGLAISCFGFSPGSNKYKIVKFSCRYDNDDRALTVWMVDIFTIGMDNTWRNIGESLPLGGRPTRTTVNSRVHWVVTECNNDELIQCFDFDCEGFQSVFPPKEFGAVHKSRRKQLRLGVMGDCLYLSDYYSFDNYFDIWVMKEYGVQESWTKKFVILVPITCISRVIKNSWMKFLDNGECLIFSGKKVWVSHNLMEKQFTEVELGDITHASISYKPSFIMLKEIARKQNWELVDIRHSKDIGDEIS